MEALTMFAVSVGFIGAFHLASRGISALSKGRKTSMAGAVKTRSDWHCFFKMSDLLGENWDSSRQQEEQQDTVQSVDRYEQRRRLQAQRPRLQA